MRKQQNRGPPRGLLLGARRGGAVGALVRDARLPRAGRGHANHDAAALLLEFSQPALPARWRRAAALCGKRPRAPRHLAPRHLLPRPRGAAAAVRSPRGRGLGHRGGGGCGGGVAAHARGRRAAVVRGRHLCVCDVAAPRAGRGLCGAAGGRVQRVRLQREHRAHLVLRRGRRVHHDARQRGAGGRARRAVCELHLHAPGRVRRERGGRLPARGLFGLPLRRPVCGRGDVGNHGQLQHHRRGGVGRQLYGCGLHHREHGA